MTKLSTASVLAFERNLDISDAVFSQYNSEATNPEIKLVEVKEKSVRGTISNRLKNTIAADPAKLDAEIQKANLQTVDVAMLDPDKDTLRVNFSCKVLPFDGSPNVCNDQDYQVRVKEVVAEYLSEQGVEELAKRYATNLVNARWLWRNRVGSESVKVTLSCKLNGEEQKVTVQNVRDMGLRDFNYQNEQLAQVASWIEMGLKGEAFVLINIEAGAYLGKGQEVYPSQELVLDTGNKKSKILYRLDLSTNQAGMHSQKVGNAIRCIDTWYSDEITNPIAIEPYGAVTTLGTAFRQPKQKMDFYSLFDNWVLKGEKPALEQQHYVMAVLIRGGVFGASGKE